MSSALISFPDILEGALFCEMLRGKRETHGLTRLTNNPKAIPSLTPQLQRPVQRLLRVAQFFRRKARGSRSLCKPYRRECLPHFRMDLAFGFLDIRQAGAFKVVYTFDDLILDRLGPGSGLFINTVKALGVVTR